MSYQGQDTFNVKDFGAVGNGIADDTLAIQRTIWKAAQHQVSAPTSFTGTFNHPSIYLPNGRYKTKNLYLPSFNRIFGDHSSILEGWDNNTSILQLGGVENRVESLNFNGGKRHVEIFGTQTGGNAVAGNTIRITDCFFRRAASTSIWMNHQYIIDGWAGRDSTSIGLSVTRCSMEGIRFFTGSFDQSTFTDCRLSWEQALWTEELCPIDELGAFNNGGFLHLENCYLIGYGINNLSSWIRTYAGGVLLENCRQGDVSECIIRIKKPSSTNYALDENFAQSTITAPHIMLKDTSIASVAQTYWMEIHDLFPQMISVKGSFSGGGLHVFNETPGIFVNTDTVVNTSTVNYIDMDPYLGAAGTFHGGTDPTDQFLPDITSKYIRYFSNQSALDYVGNDLQVQENLIQPGIYHDSQFLSSTFNIAYYNNDEIDTGYSLRELVSLNSNSVVAGSFSNWLPPQNEPGEYTFSIAVKCSTDNYAWINIVDSNNLVTQTNNTIHCNGSTHFKRIYYKFSSDGVTPQDINISFYRLQPGTVISLGLPAITRGHGRVPYLFPGNDNPKGRITQRSQLATPAYSGNWKAGDIVENIVVAAGSPLGWICTETGSPGHFEPYGAVGIAAGLHFIASGLIFPTVDAADQQEQVVTVAGASVGDAVYIGAPAALDMGLIHTARTTATNQVTIRLSNITGNPITPSGANWKINVIKNTP